MSKIGDIVEKRFPNGFMGNKMFTYRLEQSEDGLNLRIIFAETFVVEMPAGDAYAMAERISKATREMAYIPFIEKGKQNGDDKVSGRFRIPDGAAEIL